MRREWLIKKVAFDEAEAALELSDPLVDDQYRLRWGELRAKAIPGDEVWYFSSPTESWENLCGRDGYALVRAGEIVDFIVDTMS